jgi:hypothetical protein
MVRSPLTSSLLGILICATLCSGCAWHHVRPAREERLPATTMDLSAGLEAADDGTSLSDLQAMARRWKQWHAFKAVQFPFRDGDPVDLVVAVRLRQTADLHRVSNFFKEIAVGASLFTLSPVLGRTVSEVHEVRVTCRRGGVQSAPYDAVVSTDLEFGYGAEAMAAAKELDEAQMDRLGTRVLELVASGCRPAG